MGFLSIFRIKELNKKNKGNTLKEKHDYYVYIHKDKVTKEVFYVGKGRKERVSLKDGRSKAWKERSCLGYDIEYLNTGLSECEAIDIENEYLRSPLTSWKLVNIQKDCDVHVLDYAFLSEYLYYDETSETCLRWKKWNKQWNHSRRDAGDVAGFKMQVTRNNPRDTRFV